MNTTVTNPHLTTENFNDYLVKIGLNLAKEIPTHHNSFRRFLEQRCPASVFLDPASDDEVLNEITQFNVNKSSGHGDISPKVIKAIYSYIVKPLTQIFNLSFLTGKLPDALKIALETPVYKANDKHTFSNYRPISVLPCFSKILEKLMYKRAVRFINKHDLLSRYQCGFRAGHSTQQVAIELIEKITQAIERNEFTLGIFSDLSKAFDTVNHDILLDKLECYGFRGIVIEWFRNYSTNSKQTVNYRSVKSKSSIITCGVPQGSILGLLLFLIYVNDISESSNLLSFLLFADDPILFISDKDIKKLCDNADREICKVANWLAVNKLSLNVKKTHFVIFRAKNKKLTNNISINIGNQNIEQVNSTNFLGLNIDQDLSWKHHY